MDKIRNEINKIDVQIIGLLGKRMKLAKKIGKLKKKAGLPVWDKMRERKLRKTYQTKAKTAGLSRDFIDGFFDVTFSESRRIQNK